MMNAIMDLEKLGQKKSQQKKGKKKYHGQAMMPLHVLLKNKTLKKIDKETLENQLGISMGEFIKQLRKFYADGHSKAFDDIETVADVFTNKKFSKALREILRDDEKVPAELLFTISELHLSTKALNNEIDVLERYLKIFRDVYAEDIKKVAKLLGIRKTDALLLLMITQSYKGANRKMLRDRTYKFLGALYEAAGSSEDGVDERQLKKVIKILYKGRIHDFVLYALTEKASNSNNLQGGEKSVWSAVTNVALDILEAMDKDERKELLKSYAKSRKNNVQVKRRVSLLNHINKEDYKGIHRTVERLISNGMDKELFN